MWTLVGREGHKQLIAAFRAAFPDLRVAVEDLLEEGDRVALRWRAEGTHRGELMGIAPTGRRVTLTGIEILRIAGGKIAEYWQSWDRLGMYQQLGAVPGTPDLLSKVRIDFAKQS